LGEDIVDGLMESGDRLERIVHAAGVLEAVGCDGEEVSEGGWAAWDFGFEEEEVMKEISAGLIRGEGRAAFGAQLGPRLLMIGRLRPEKRRRAAALQSGIRGVRRAAW
jgi:hypothetical protein